MEKYFVGLPFEKVMIDGMELYKASNGSYYRIDEGTTFVAIEATDEAGLKIYDFEDVDLFDKDSPESDMLGAVRSVLSDLAEMIDTRG